MPESRFPVVVRRVVGVLVAIVVAVAGYLLYDPNPDTQVNGRFGTSVTVTPPINTDSTDAPTTGDPSGLPLVARSALPPEAIDTVRAIEADGPFRFDRDGVTFENREGLLPAQVTGYYHEYTVVTPGSDDRGARRIIAGAAGELYYTDDHYGSFARIIR